MIWRVVYQERAYFIEGRINAANAPRTHSAPGQSPFPGQTLPRTYTPPVWCRTDRKLSRV